MLVRRSFAWVALLLVTGSGLQAQEIAWRKDYAVVRQEAADKNRPLILTFTSQNCRWCVALDSTTYRDPAIVQYVAERFVPMKVEAEVYPNLVTALGIQGFPTVVVASASGRILEVNRGYIEAAPFGELLVRALAKLPSATPAVPKTDVVKQDVPKKPGVEEKKEEAVAKEAPKTPATTASITKEPTPPAKEPASTVKEATPPATGAKTETPLPEKKEGVVKESASPTPPSYGPPSTTDTVAKGGENDTNPAPIPPSAYAPPVPATKLVPELKTATEPVWMADDLRRATEAASRSEFPRAVLLLKNLLKDDIQWPSQARASGLLREIERQAALRLARVKEAESKGDVADAIRQAQEIVSRFDGTEAAAEAMVMVPTLSSRMEDKDRERLIQAQAIVKQADEDFRAGQWLPCLLRCEDLQARYSDLPECVKAGELIAKIKGNPSSLQRICDGLPEVAGQVYLTMAEVKIKQGEPQQAMFFLERVLQAFPSSKHAEMAQVRLSQIQGPPPVTSMEDRKE